MLMVKIRQMAPLYKIKLLLNLVWTDIFRIQWPWCVQTIVKSNQIKSNHV